MSQVTVSMSARERLDKPQSALSGSDHMTNTDDVLRPHIEPRQGASLPRLAANKLPSLISTRTMFKNYFTTDEKGRSKAALISRKLASPRGGDDFKSLIGRMLDSCGE